MIQFRCSDPKNSSPGELGQSWVMSHDTDVYDHESQPLG